jgi:hypothetical protein
MLHDVHRHTVPLHFYHFVKSPGVLDLSPGVHLGVFPRCVFLVAVKEYKELRS